MTIPDIQNLIARAIKILNAIPADTRAGVYQHALDQVTFISEALREAPYDSDFNHIDIGLMAARALGNDDAELADLLSDIDYFAKALRRKV